MTGRWLTGARGRTAVALATWLLAGCFPNPDDLISSQPLTPVAVTGGATGGAAGGAGGAAPPAGQCPSSGTDTACGACLKSQCCQPLSACLRDSFCAPLVSCIADCPSGSEAQACINTCMGQYPAGVQLLLAFLNCGDQQCGTACK